MCSGKRSRSTDWALRLIGQCMHADNCGGLGQSVCPDGTCKDPYVSNNQGGSSDICRKPEDIEEQGAFTLNSPLLSISRTSGERSLLSAQAYREYSSVRSRDLCCFDSEGDHPVST